MSVLSLAYVHWRKLVLIGVLVVFLVPFMEPLGREPGASIGRWLPIPAARIGWHIVWYREVLRERDGLLRWYIAAGKTVPNKDVFDVALIEGLLRTELVYQQVRRLDLPVSSEDVTRETNRLAVQVGSRDALEREVRQTYGWSLRTFERQVVRPYVEMRTLARSISARREMQAVKRARAEEARMRLEQGEQFDVIVLEYSEDATGALNGDQGWWTEETLPEVWKTPALRLDVGAVSPIVEEEDRFTILRVDERADDRVHLSAIMIEKQSLEDILREARTLAPPRVYLRLSGG